MPGARREVGPTSAERFPVIGRSSTRGRLGRPRRTAQISNLRSTSRVSSSRSSIRGSTCLAQRRTKACGVGPQGRPLIGCSAECRHPRRMGILSLDTHRRGIRTQQSLLVGCVHMCATCGGTCHVRQMSCAQHVRHMSQHVRAHVLHAVMLWCIMMSCDMCWLTQSSYVWAIWFQYACVTHTNAQC